MQELIILKCHQDLNLLTSKHYFHAVFDGLTFVNRKHKVTILGYTLLSNQIQLLISLKDKNKVNDYVENFKTVSRNEIVRLLKAENKKELLEKIQFTQREQRYKVWATSCEETVLQTADEVHQAIEKVHQEAVNYKLAKSPEEYNYASAKFYISNLSTEIKISDYRKMKIEE